ncbi:IPT/TIG domain-containing protein, partial [Flavobacterium sp. LB2P6]|uniref:IPT/TIG domain-containing protein n=1 Tax=Flavobacterium sp. LB2P6 TaxID=3401714 RepID=UPI003AAA69AD
MEISNKIEELGDCYKKSDHSNKKNNNKVGFFSMVLFLLMTSVQMVYAQVPTITGFSPASAKAGATVTITGTNFTGATSVKFGTQAATSFTVVNSSTITAVVSSSGESGRIFVTTAAGTAEIVNFVFLPPPSCNIVGPLKACFGTNLTFTVEIANSGNDQTSTPPVPELILTFPPGPDNTTNGAMIISNTPFVYNPVTNSGTLTAVLFPGTTTGKILGVLRVNAPGGSSECSASIVITDVDVTTSFLPITCFGGTTNLVVNATSSGNTSYKYTLHQVGSTNPDIVINFTPFTTVSFPNLVAGDYTVTVEGNDLGCKAEANLTIQGPPSNPVLFNCPTVVTETGCQTQDQINTKFNAWLATFSTSGGANPVLTRSPITPLAPGKCGGSTTVTWTVTSDCEATKTCTSTFTVTPDTAVPVITATGTPTNGTLGCNPTADAITAALGTATATDNCGSLSPTFTDATVVITGCLRSQTRTWNVTDACGNAAAPVSRTATWTVDITLPVITATGTPTNGTLGCNPTAAAITAALGTATATDNCGSVSPTFTDATVVITGCLRSQTRTWNVTDACGNAAAPVSRTATWTVDITLPVIMATGTPTNGTLGCNPTADAITAALGTATATDNCGSVSPTFTDATVVITGCLRSQTRTWNVTDACGNAAAPVSRTATWTVDITLPVITATGTPTNGTLGCNPAAAAITAALGTATATDNCGSVSPTFTDATVVITGCLRSQTRTWNVTDACGNAAAPVSRTATWTVDITLPVIMATGTPTNGTLGCNPTADAITAALGTATATDNCGSVSPTFTDATVVITGCLRSQTRTWNVTDACGNAAAPVSRTATWTVDITLPVIMATGTPTNGTLGCNPTAAAITAALGTATATDNCGSVSPTFTDATVVITGCLRSQTRTWNVTDACGNAAAPVSRTATWTVDITLPVITATGTPTNGTLGCNPTADAITAALGTATATDNCGSVSPTFTDATVVITGCLRSQTRTW